MDKFTNQLTLGGLNACREYRLIGADYQRVKDYVNRTTARRDITRADIEAAVKALKIAVEPVTTP